MCDGKVNFIVFTNKVSKVVNLWIGTEKYPAARAKSHSAGSFSWFLFINVIELDFFFWCIQFSGVIGYLHTQKPFKKSLGIDNYRRHHFNMRHIKET